MDYLRPFVDNLVNYCQNKLQFSSKPRILFKQDIDNSKKVLGTTAFYDPNRYEITIFSTGRHPKDMLRSIAHELVHHSQHEKGQFDNQSSYNGQDYAQKDPVRRNMEKQAYLLGNMFFRDWEDGIKTKKKEITFMIGENKIRAGIRQALREAIIKENIITNRKEAKEVVDNQIFESVDRALSEGPLDRMLRGPGSGGRKKYCVNSDGQVYTTGGGACRGAGDDGPFKTREQADAFVDDNFEDVSEGVKIITPEQEAGFHSKIFEPRLVALNARLMSDWIKPR